MLQSPVPQGALLQVANAPYTLATPLGQTRFHAADTAVDPDPELDGTIFSDAELTYCLSLSGQNPMLAAAMALEAASTDAAKISVMVMGGDERLDRRQVATELAARAEKLRVLAGLAPAVDAPDAVFTTDSENGLVAGTMDCW